MPRDKIRLSAASVLTAGLDFRDALGGPGLELATDRLALAAEQSLSQFDETAAMAFDGLGAQPTPERRQEAADEVLASALGQFQVANTLLAASIAVGEEGEAEPSALDESLQQLDRTVAVLAVAPPEDPPSPDSATEKGAVLALCNQLSKTLEELTKRSLDVVTESITGIRDGGPKPMQDMWDWVKEKVRSDEIGGRLAKLGLRALQGAVDLLNRVVPSERLAAVRERVERLVRSAADGSPGLATLGVVLGADEAARGCREKLDRSGLDPGKLGAATGELVELGGKHAKVMDLCAWIGTAVSLAAPVTLFVKLVIPHLHLILLGVHVLLVAAVVVIGREYVGTSNRIVGRAAE
ncbi:hypothetical protein [Amycolatopsis sp. lyj-23]|uniref:hypothetical protein n=1 Tax=Amycolatopsis sp. lyj-23 TaxID=2789283 RepID=UPI00397A14F3